MSSYLRSLAAGDLGPTSRFPRQAYHGRGLVCFGCGLGVVWLPGLWPDLSGVWSVEVYKIFTQQKIQPIMDHTIMLMAWVQWTIIMFLTFGHCWHFLYFQGSLGLSANIIAVCSLSANNYISLEPSGDSNHEL